MRIRLTADVKKGRSRVSVSATRRTVRIHLGIGKSDVQQLLDRLTNGGAK